MTIDLEQFKGHTPGPWHAEQPWSGFSALRGPSGELIFGLAAGAAAEKQPDEVCEVNAALLAASPALLSEVRRLKEALTFYASEENWKGRIAGTEWTTAVADDGGAIARSALSSSPVEKEKT